MKKLIALIILAIALVFPSQAMAIPYQLVVFTDTSTTEEDLSLLNLQVDVTSDATYGAIFTFYNYSTIPSSIADVYFDDGVLLSLASIESGPGTSFSSPATPGDLPSGNNLIPPFVTTAGFSADSDPPVQPNGVNPGEWVKIKFLLTSGSSFDDVINSISNSELRIGAHVQGFRDSTSQSVVNNVTPTPEPTTVLLLGSLAVGLFGVAGVRRRKA